MRLAVLALAGLALAQPLRGQQASADSAAIVALELELSRLLAAGQVAEYATHLTADYARTTQQGTLERHDVALAGAWGGERHAADRPLGPSVWRCGSADGCRGGSGYQRASHPHHQDVRASAGAVAARGAPQFGHRGALTPDPQAARTGVVAETAQTPEDPPCLRIVAQSWPLSC